MNKVLNRGAKNGESITKDTNPNILMIIKQRNLNLRFPKANIYFLIGQDVFLLNYTAARLKLIWRQQNTDINSDEPLSAKSPPLPLRDLYLHKDYGNAFSYIQVQTGNDWSIVKKLAYNYTLFSSSQLLDIRYEHQTLDQAGKEFLIDYLKNINLNCTMLCCAPNLSTKQLQFIESSADVCIIQVFPLNKLEMENWVKKSLAQISYPKEVPALIVQYTEGNMLACTQVVKKLNTLGEQNLTLDLVKEQLIGQHNYQLFELREACLLKNHIRAIHIIRHAENTNVEPNIILWILVQEIRLLIQLKALVKSIPFHIACQKLNIWSTKVKLYQNFHNHMPAKHLLSLLPACKQIDESIKSSQNKQIWQNLEQLALSLCLTTSYNSS